MPISILWRQEKSIPKIGTNAVEVAGDASSHHHAIGSARRFPYTMSPNAAVSTLVNSFEE
jgi:hypothetical protein